MAFTRFYDDPYKTQTRVEDSSYLIRYMLDKPGQGTDLPFIEDPHIRMQGWGANLQTNTINLESDLRGLTRVLNRDLIGFNSHSQTNVRTDAPAYSSQAPFVEITRMTHPSWMYKDLEQSRWESPFLNPQNNIEFKWNHNIQTRILEKDYHVPRIPIVENMQNSDFYLTGSSLCLADNNGKCI